MNRKSREELNALSKEVFGLSSRWQKLVNKGFQQPEILEKMIPNSETGKVEKVQFTTHNKITLRHTEESVGQLMTNLKKQRESAMETLKAMKDSKSEERAT